MHYDLSRQNVASVENVVRQSTGHYDEINELDIRNELPTRNLTQLAGYSIRIPKENIRLHTYDSLIHEEFPDESIEQLQLSSTAVESKVVVHAGEFKDCGPRDSNGDSCHNGTLTDREGPYCETEIPSDYLTII